MEAPEAEVIDALVVAAQAVLGQFPIGSDGSAGSCAAALLTVSGRMFSGICIDVPCSMGFCAEHAAMAEMLKTRETQVAAIVAVNKNGIVPPCGRCREFMVQIDLRNLDAFVVLSQRRVKQLRDLLPEAAA